MDRMKANAIRLALDRLFQSDEAKQIEEQFKILLHMRSGSFKSTELSIRLLATDTEPDGTVVDTKAEDFKKQAFLYGLKPEDLGRKFRYFGETYRVSGLNPRAKKYPICAVREPDRKRFKFRVADVKIGLANENLIAKGSES